VMLPDSDFHPICSLVKGGRTDQMMQVVPFSQHDPSIYLLASAGLGTISPLRLYPPGQVQLEPGRLPAAGTMPPEQQRGEGKSCFFPPVALTDKNIQNHRITEW